MVVKIMMMVMQIMMMLMMGGIFPFTSELQWFPGFLPPLPWPWGVETMMIINEVLEIYWVYII